jgi:hypothetical protein
LVGTVPQARRDALFSQIHDQLRGAGGTERFLDGSLTIDGRGTAFLAAAFDQLQRGVGQAVRRALRQAGWIIDPVEQVDQRGVELEFGGFS